MKVMRYLLTALPLLFLAAPVLLHADTAFQPLAPVSSGPLAQLYSAPTGDLSVFVNSLFKFAIAVGAIAAVLRLAYAGYLYMGSDMWSKKGEAKTVIGDVTLGIMLLLGVWLILNQINPDILKLNALQSIQSSPAAPTGYNDPNAITPVFGQ